MLSTVVQRRDGPRRLHDSDDDEPVIAQWAGRRNQW